MLSVVLDDYNGSSSYLVRFTNRNSSKQTNLRFETVIVIHAKVRFLSCEAKGSQSKRTLQENINLAEYFYESKDAFKSWEAVVVKNVIKVNCHIYVCEART